MRLIDADALLSTENQHYAILADEMYVTVRRVELMPTIDAVPVVRCKDCKHSLKDDLFRTRWCQKPGHVKEVKDEFFCADGERKDDETPDGRF